MFLQFLGAIFVYINIVRIDSIGINFLDNFLDNFSLIWPLITIIWLVGITNAFNWIDGLDGLSSGISIIISLSTCFRDK